MTVPTSTRWMDGLEPRQRALLDRCLAFCVRPDILDQLAALHAREIVTPDQYAFLVELLRATQEIAVEDGLLPAVTIPPLASGGSTNA